METTHVSDLAVLTELVATGGELAGAKMHFYTDGVEPNPAMAPADFTDAGSTGLAPVVVVWGTPYNGPDGVPAVPTQLFNPVATVVPAEESVIGWVLKNAAGTKVLAASKFATPKPIAAVGDGFAFVAIYRRYDGLTSEVD